METPPAQAMTSALTQEPVPEGSSSLVVASASPISTFATSVPVAPAAPFILVGPSPGAKGHPRPQHAIGSPVEPSTGRRCRRILALRKAAAAPPGLQLSPAMRLPADAPIVAATVPASAVMDADISPAMPYRPIGRIDTVAGLDVVVPPTNPRAPLRWSRARIGRRRHLVSVPVAMDRTDTTATGPDDAMGS